MRIDHCSNHLDTNIVSAHLQRPVGLQHRFVQHGGRIAIPTILLGHDRGAAGRRPGCGAGLTIWVQVHTVRNQPLDQSLRLDLGAGEAEAFALSIECSIVRGMRLAH
jgi:hypothetical protein